MLPLSTICILSCLLFCAPKPVKGRGTCFIPKKLNNKGPSQGPSIVSDTFTRSCHLPQETDVDISVAVQQASVSSGSLATIYLRWQGCPILISLVKSRALSTCSLSGFSSVGLRAFHLCSLLCFCVRADLCQCPQCQQQQAFRFTNP